MPATNSNLKDNAKLFAQVFTEAMKLEIANFDHQQVLKALKEKFSPAKLQPLLTGQVSIQDAVHQYLYGAGMADNMEDKTGIYKHREWRGARDTLYDYGKWLELWGILGKWLVKHPVTNVSALLRYRWMANYLTTPSFFDRNVPGFRSTMLRAGRMNMNTIAKLLTVNLEDIFAADEHLHPGNENSKKYVCIDAYMPKLFMAGFAEHKGMLAHLIPHYLPSIINQHAPEHYIDVTESYGVPPDVCGLPSMECGVAIEDDFPKIGCCYISCNMPCDGSIMASTILDRRFNMPTFVLNTPMRHTREDTQQYAVEELRECIKFMEEHTGEKYDYNLLREACERWNIQNDLRLEKWDMNMTDEPPHYGASNWTYRVFTYQDACAHPVAIANDQKVNKMMREHMGEKRSYPTEVRHRCILWNTLTNMYCALDEWLLNCWGIESVFEFIEDQGHQPIDTSSDDAMLAGVSKVLQEATMRVHSKGGYEAFTDDLWTYVERYHADMVIMYDQISCKGPGAIAGLLEDDARKRGIRMVWLKQDLVDPRTISRRDMRDQISKYMEAVMGEKPLDPTLLDFDDSESW
ncbi:MAG: 2-hydroxyacyl-CoA dehydratase family protein [Oscillospiraceae bacterium]